MLKDIIKSYFNIEDIQKMYDIKLEEGENSLDFYLNQSKKVKYLPLNKFILIKNRKSGKRISKEFKSSKVTLTGDELEKLGENGVYDIFLRLNIRKANVLLRPIFTSQNIGKAILDKKNHSIFESYSTVNKELAFKRRESLFKTYLSSVDIIDNKLSLSGKIKLLDDIEFDEVEIISKSNKEGRRLFPCQFKKDGEDYLFSFILDIKVDEKDIIPSSWNLNIRLKNDDIIVANDIILSDKLSDFKNEESYYLKSVEIENDKEILLYSTKGFYLRYHLLQKGANKNYIQRAKNIDSYEYFKENEAIDENMVFFESFHGKYNNNPKYIYEKMLELRYDKKYKFVWSLTKDKEEEKDYKNIIPGNPIIVYSNDKNYFKYLAKSKYRINNTTFSHIIDKRDDLIYLQTWHGTALKRLGSDIKVQDPGVSWTHFNREVKTWNYLITANEFSTTTFERAFNYKNEILEYGYPANDIFYKDNTEFINKFKKEHNIPNDKKIILYAPTFRDDKKDANGNRIFNLELDLEKMYKKLKDDYFLIIKTHYVISKNLDISNEMNDFVLDLSNHDDVHELFIISDILITDYSSVFFDYAHSQRPILFFMPDLASYISSRGIYHEVIEDLPGPKLINNNEVLDALKNIDHIEEEYSDKYQEFYKKYCSIGHGNASEKIIKKVFAKVEK